MVDGRRWPVEVVSRVMRFSFPASSPGVVGMVNMNNNNNGTMGRVCQRNVRSIAFILYGASGRTLTRSPIPIGLRLNHDVARKLKTNGHPRQTHSTTRRDVRSVHGRLGSNAGVMFVATKVKKKAKAKTTPIVTHVTGRVSVLAINVIAVPFVFRKRGGVVRTLSNMRHVTRRISTLLIVGGRHLHRVCTSLAFVGTFNGTSSALSVTTGDVTRVVAVHNAIGLSFTSIGAVLGSNNITVVDAKFNRNRGHIAGTVSSTLRSPLLGGGSVFGTGGMVLGISFYPSSRLVVRRVGRVRRFVDGFHRNIRIV